MPRLSSALMGKRGKGVRLSRIGIWHKAAIAVALLVLLPLIGGLWWLHAPMGLRPPAQEAAEISLGRGASPRAVAQAWAQAGVDVSPDLLYAWFRISGRDRQIRAGSYAALPETTPWILLQRMTRGDQAMETVRFIEGWTFRQMRSALKQAPGLRQTIAGLDERALMRALGTEDLPAEGWFFPDTYAYSRGVSDLTILRQAHAAMKRQLDEAWQQRHPQLPLKSKTEALILASIVEKETGRASDRAQIAGVFINRLRLGMPLQTDPTVIYGLGAAFDGDLRRRDLQTDTPFNTYTRRGLPPHAIAMPGAASLRAAVQPQDTRALYFVARGDGSSQFSESLDEHNRAVARYQKMAGSR